MVVVQTIGGLMVQLSSTNKHLKCEMQNVKVYNVKAVNPRIFSHCTQDIMYLCTSRVICSCISMCLLSVIMCPILVFFLFMCMMNHYVLKDNMFEV